MADLETVLADLARRLEEVGIPYMVVGGMANAVWGSPRSTVDLDVTVLLDPAAAPSVVQSLGAAYTSRVGDAEGFAVETRVLPLRHVGGVQIDVIFALLPFEEEAIRRSVSIDVQGTPVRFCTPEDLVLHKIVSERDRDRKDVEEILRRRMATLDRSYLDPRVHELATLLDRPGIERWYLKLLDG